LKVLWAVACQSSSVDQETNTVSLFNLLEQISVPEPPRSEISSDDPILRAATGAFELFILTGRSDLNVGERGPARVCLHFPSDEPPASFQIEIDLTSAQRNRIKISLPALPVSGEGTYRFVIEAADATGGWNQLFEIPLEVSYFG